ncbi:MAG: CvpA family protein [Clostridiales bacterium]|nr:CvpA family protein [Clostridiales bacterium]
MKNKAIKTLICLGVTLLFGGVSFYLTLPALNIHSMDFYSFLLSLAVVYIVCSLVVSGFRSPGGFKGYLTFIKNQCRVMGILALAVIAVIAVGRLLSWQVIRAGAYKNLLTVENGDFSKDVTEISVDDIPMLDRDSAQRLGDRKLGELSDMVSQFEVADDYSQINYNNRPVRVTPLEYGDLIKWFNNRQEGLPAYLVIDMATQAVDVVRLDEGIKYSKSEHLGRNLYRHIRFHYPGYMFSEPTFEVDEEGNPYWICPRVIKKIGLFGGSDIKGAVLVNAVNGECEYKEEVPKWVDRLYPAELITEQYNYYGRFINGFINSVFGQKGVTSTTSGYNYIALNDDVYMYTGITSAGSDQSNIGFILSNQRTKETKFYSVAGATEQSAMASAEGVVQHLGYSSTFPLLLNVAGEPTYFMSLKDNANLVKMYAMVNVRQYQIVGTGASYRECEQKYTELLSSNSIIDPTSSERQTIEGTVTQIRTAVIDGNSYYYIELDQSGKFYEISAADNRSVIAINTGDRVEIEADTSKSDIICAYGINRK